MARPPTEKQVKFAEAISKRTNTSLPNIWTRQSLFLYIRDNRPKYDMLTRLRTRRRWEDPEPIDVDEDWYQMTAEGLDPATGGFADNY